MPNIASTGCGAPVASLLLLTLLSGPLLAQDVTEPPRLPYDSQPEEIVISLSGPASVETGAVWSPGRTVNLLALLGDDATVVQSLRATDGIVIRAPGLRDEAGMDAAIQSLMLDPGVVGAERNYIYYADGRPADPRVGDMWHLSALSAFKAWDRRAGSPGIVVAVIDNGIQLDHEDLRGRIWSNPKEIPGNGVDDDGNGYIDDIHGWNFEKGNNRPAAEVVAVAGEKCQPHPSKRIYEVHATHVAGTIGAVAGNGRGGVGISHDVRIMPLKVMGGPCGAGRASGVIEAIAYAVKNGAHIINMSLGGKSRSEIMLRELQAAVAAGVVVVAAAGNVGKDIDREPMYPAAFALDGLIAVAATGRDGALATFSNYGVRSVDIGAPGVGILNAVPKGADPERADSDYAFLSGTSMAAPIVTGAIALMRAQNPALDPAEVERRLARSADPAPALSGKVRSGGGLNLERLLEEAARPYQRPPPVAAKPIAPRPLSRPVVPKAAAPAAAISGPKSIDGVTIEGPAARSDAKPGAASPMPREIPGGKLY